MRKNMTDEERKEMHKKCMEHYDSLWNELHKKYGWELMQKVNKLCELEVEIRDLEE